MGVLAKIEVQIKTPYLTAIFLHVNIFAQKNKRMINFN